VPYKGMMKQTYTIYNQAVTKDAQFRMTQVKNKATDFSNSPAQSDYKIALDTIQSFIGQYKDKLVADNVYGNVLALKSMCEYGLENYDNAAAIASQALPYLKSSTSDGTSRDNALMTAMPGLVKANQLYEKMPKDKKKVEMSKYNDIAALAKSALSDLEAGRKATDEKKTNEYLLTSKLSVYKNWLDTAFYTADAKSSDAEKAQKRAREDEILGKAKADVTLLEGVLGTSSSTVAIWKALIGL